MCLVCFYVFYCWVFVCGFVGFFFPYPGSCQTQEEVAEGVEFSSLEVFRSCVGMALSNLTNLEVRRWLKSPVFSNLRCDIVIISPVT